MDLTHHTSLCLPFACPTVGLSLKDYLDGKEGKYKELMTKVEEGGKKKKKGLKGVMPSAEQPLLAGAGREFTRAAAAAGNVAANKAMQKGEGPGFVFEEDEDETLRRLGTTLTKAQQVRGVVG